MLWSGVELPVAARSLMYHNVVSGNARTVVQAGNVTGGVHIHVPDEERLVPQHLPALPRGFTGRERLLDAVQDAVAEAEDGTLRLVVLSGMAGVGKTALAVSWGYRYAERFPDGQLYVDLRGYSPDQPFQSTDVLGGFLRALGVAADRVPVDGAERSALFRTLMAERKVLVVLDNARNEEQVRPLLPGPGDCVVLVTSRSSLTGLIVDQGGILVPVDVLTDGEAFDLLRTLIGQRVQADPAAAAVLAGRCARLPLALRIVAGLAGSMSATGLAELADILADEEERLDVLDTGNDPRTSLRTVFSWSYNSLPPDAAKLFRLLGVVPGTSTSRQAIAALADVSPVATNRLLATLSAAQLVVDNGHGRINMHDLLRSYAIELANTHDGDDDVRAAMVRLFDYYLHGAEHADRLLTPNRFRIPLDGSPGLRPKLGNYQDAINWMTAEQDAIVAASGIDDPVLDSRRWQLAYTMRGYFFLAKDWDAWIRTHERALTAAARLGDVAAQATTHNNLGQALLERGEADAASTHYLKALELHEQSGDVRGVGNALGNYAWVLHHRGDYAGALEYAIRAMVKYKECGARINAGITLRGIAIFEANLGQFTEAVEHLHEAMEIFTEFAADLDMVMALNCLGEVHGLAQHTEESAEAHRRAVVMARAQESVYEEARAHWGIGRVAVFLENREHASAELREAFELFRSLSAVEADHVAQELARLHQTGQSDQAIGA
jgi:tetratricopeptide (TPR) repeat protein